MSWLTKIALKKRWLTFIIVALLTGASIWATLTLEMELIPNIELPMTSIVAIYPDAKPEQVVDEVSIPIEEAIPDSDNLRQVISTSADGTSFTFVLFDYGTDMDNVNDNIRRNLSELDLPAAVRDLPSKMPQIKDNPQLYEIDINMMPVVMVSLTGDITPGQLEDIALTRIMPKLQSIDGVYEVTVEGGGQDKILITLDPEKMNQSGISMSRVASVLASQEYDSLIQIEDRNLGTDSVVLGDIANVELGPPPATAVSRTNGKPSVNISVMKESEANTVSVANAVIDELESIETTLEDDMEIITILDQSEYIERSISDLERNAVIGCGLAIIVVFLFLMAFRASLVTAVSIPLSILIGFLVMRLWGITINMLTLSAMAIAVGRVIDNSIVVLEVIYRRIQQGDSFQEAALGGVREIVSPITSSTVATVIIFLPLAFVGGIVGEMFVPFALTITFALVASLLVALMVIPPMSNFPRSQKNSTEVRHTWYQRFYTVVLRWALSHRAATLVITAVLFFGSFATLPIVGTSFLPGMGEQMLTVELEMPQGTELIATQEAVIQVEEILEENPEVFIYQTTAGTSGTLMGGFSALMGGGASVATITVLLDPESNLEQEVEELRQALEGVLDEGVITVSTGDAGMAAMTGNSLDISILGDNYEDIASASRELFYRLEGMDGVADLALDISDVEARLDIQPDLAKMMASGLTQEQLQGISQEFFFIRMGGDIAQASIDGNTYDIFLKGIASDLSSIETARQLRVGWPTSVTLEDIATVELSERPTRIQRIDEKLAASITGSITAQNVGAVNMAIQQEIDSLSLPAGIEITTGGTMEMMQESFSGMFIAIITAIVLAYAVIVVTFRSFLNPVIIMLSMPLAIVGALLGLLVTGHPLGISAMMGLLMLVGIVLTNAIVLIDYVEQLRKKGLGIHDALVEGGRIRLRPILMTALTTMVAMLPLALGLGEGTIMAAELAVVVIGGLFSSTLLTLLVIPVIYSLVKGLRRG